MFYSISMRTSFTIQRELYESVSALSETEKRPVAVIFRQAIREYLKRAGVETDPAPVKWGGKRERGKKENSPQT